MASSAKATAAVTTAQKQHQAAVAQLAHAQRALADLEEVDRGKTKLTVAQQIQLRNAREGVKTATENLKAKTENLSKAQDHAKESTSGADDALEQLNKRLAGQSAASVDTFSGKIDVIRTKLGDWTAEFGQKYGPAITATGPFLLIAGLAMDVYQGHVAKVAAAQAALAVEADASAADVAAADAAIAAATTEAEGAVAAGGAARRVRRPRRLVGETP